MKDIKKIILIILVSTTILILNGCSNFSKDDLKKPIQEYLKTNYGLTGDIKILSATNFASAGVDHEVYVEIDKPYHTFVNLFVNRDTLQVIPDEGENIYLKLFKGAYIQQNAEIIRFSNYLINKYHLVSPKRYDEKRVNEDYRINPADLYYLQINFGGKTQISKLVNQFKKEQTINTVQILPTIIKNEPEVETLEMGIVNFIYSYEVTNNKKKPPHSKELFEEFKSNKLLKKGLYNLEIQAEDKEGYPDDERSSFTLFRVDENGNYTIIPVRSN